MATIGAREMLLLLIGLDETPSASGLGGLTRIQKLLYLLETEEKIRPSGDGFKFEAYKAGPYSPRIYDDLEFLENLNFIKRTKPSGQGIADELTTEELTTSAMASDPEKAEVDLQKTTRRPENCRREVPQGWVWDEAMMPREREMGVSRREFLIQSSAALTSAAFLADSPSSLRV
jgi:hypothetical protein